MTSVKHKDKKVLFLETDELPVIRKTLRLYFYPKDMMDAIRKKKYELSGVRMNENEIFTEALFKYAIEMLGKEEVENCQKKK